MACSCPLPWAVAALALFLAVAALMFSTKQTAQATQGHDLPTSQITTSVVDDRLTTTQCDLEETKRVLNEAQSGLAERDREISAANDELRSLRRALAECRAKASESPAQAP